MNKSVMKCCICNNESIGQFITINNKKYHLCCIEQLQQENKILRENAEHNDEVVDKVNWENMLLKKENQELKSQLEGTTHCFDEEEHEKLKKQQKEFIEWLEDIIQQQETLMAENQEKLYFLMYEDEKEDLKLYSRKAYTRRIILEEILQKYKEIIGGKHE